LLVAAVLAAVLALSAVLAFGSGGRRAQATVVPNSVAVVDPASNAVLDDVRVGNYPGPLAADDSYVYSGNIGSATVTRIDARTREAEETFSLSRALDLVAARDHLWSANGGVAGHTPFPPGTVTDLDLFSYALRTIRVGPGFEGMGGNEASTTVAANGDGTQIWVGNKESRTLLRIDPDRHAVVGRLHGITTADLAVVGSPGSGETVWVGDQTRDLLLRVSGSSGRVTHRITLPGQPARLVANRRAVWVLTRGTRALDQWQLTSATTPALWRVDPRTNAPIRRIDLPLTPIRLALGAGSVWVTAVRVLTTRGGLSDRSGVRPDRGADPPPRKRRGRHRRQPRPRVGRRATHAVARRSRRSTQLNIRSTIHRGSSS
jgi:hypothetical protein